MTTRSEIKKEVAEDLSKPVEQLLTDIHEELLCDKRPVQENIAHSNKRFASLITRSAIASQKAADESILVQRKVVILTKLIFALTVVLVFLTLILAVPVFKELCNIPKATPNTNDKNPSNNQKSQH